MWRRPLLAGRWPRLRHVIVSLVALLGLWFYHYWSLLGFNYLS